MGRQIRLMYIGFFVSLLGLLMLVGCGNNNMSNYEVKSSATESDTETSAVSEEPATTNPEWDEKRKDLIAGITPESDKVSVVGQAIDEVTGEPLADIAVRLTDVVWDDAHENAYTVFNDAQNPGVMTDEQGFFVLENVSDKEYIMFFSRFGGIDEDVVFVLDPDKVDTGQIFDFEAGEVTDLGTLEIREPRGK